MIGHHCRPHHKPSEVHQLQYITPVLICYSNYRWLLYDFTFSQKAYVFAFLLSARLFIPPSELLARVCELCIKQQQLDQSPLDMVSTAPHVHLQTEAATYHMPPVLGSGKNRYILLLIFIYIYIYTSRSPAVPGKQTPLGHSSDAAHSLHPDQALWEATPTHTPPGCRSRRRAQMPKLLTHFLGCVI